MIMGREILIPSFISVILFAALCPSIDCSAINILYSQASPITAETPKVILQQGTAGTSTIYMNATSAKASVTVFNAPSLVGTGSAYYPTSYPFQRKTFYANGRFWVFYSDGTNIVYKTSTDGMTWSEATTVRAGAYGYYFSVWFDGTYVHYAVGRSSVGEALFYRRGTPNADGTITWSTTAEEVAGEAVSDVYYYRRQTWAEGDLWVMDASYSTTANYTTEIVTGTTAAGSYYYIKPFANNTVSNGTALPAGIMLQGWRTATPVTLKEAGYCVYGYVRNRDASSHAGYVYAKLWKSQYSNMSGAVAISGWGSSYISFSATAGEEKAFSITFDVTNPPNNEYLYVEFVWRIATASSSPTAGLYLRAETSYSYIRQYGWAYCYPCVSADSDGYPYVAYRRYSYYSYPYVTKASFNNGTWLTADGFPYRLRTSSSGYWRVAALPLTENKTYILYNNRYTTYGRLWNGSSFGTEETVTTTDIQYPEYFSAVAEGDNVHLAFLTTSPYNINYTKRVYGVGWTKETTIQATATSTSAPLLSFSANNLYCFWAGKSQYVDVTSERAANSSIRFTPSGDNYAYQNVTYVNETLAVTAPLSGSRGDDVGVWVNLPWNFTYYGVNKTRIYVCSNGFGIFDESYNGYSNSLSEMQNHKMIGAFWDDLRTDVNADDGIYAENMTDRVVFYWKATRYGASGDTIKMQLVLFQNGTIQFNWGDIVNLANFSPTCGLGNMKDHVYYKKCVNGTWDVNATDWIDESAEALTRNDRLTCFYKTYNDELIGIAYVTTKQSPYKIKFASIREKFDYVLKVTNTVTDAWKIRLRAFDQLNISRLYNCTIYFHNGSGLSRQIYIYNGSYSQQFGSWYDLAGSSTVYITMTASADSTGASYVYSYLEVLIPNTTTYNLMIITFEIS
jgi:hypothetical protein